LQPFPTPVVRKADRLSNETTVVPRFQTRGLLYDIHDLTRGVALLTDSHPRLDHAARFSVVSNIPYQTACFPATPNIAQSRVFYHCTEYCSIQPRVLLLHRIFPNQAACFTAVSNVTQSCRVFSCRPEYSPIMLPALLEPAGAARIPRTCRRRVSRTFK